MSAMLRVVGCILLLTLSSPAAEATDPPSGIPDLVALIEVEMAAGRHREAEQAGRRLVERHPGYADGYLLLASALESQERNREAAGVLLGAGRALVESGLAATGVDYLRMALRLDPDSPAIRGLLGQALLRVREYKEAAGLLRSALESSPASAALPLKLSLGAALWEDGEFVEAEVVYRDGLKTSGRSLPALQSLAAMLLWNGSYAEARDLLDEAVALDPGSIQLQMDLANALRGAGEDDRAVALLRAIVLRAPEVGAARYQLAILLRRRGETGAAREQMEAFQELHEADQERTHRIGLQRARLDAGWDLLRQGKADDAAGHFAKLEQGPESLLGLAIARSDSGDHRGAVQALEQAILLDPERQDLRLRLARERVAAGVR